MRGGGGGASVGSCCGASDLRALTPSSRSRSPPPPRQRCGAGCWPGRSGRRCLRRSPTRCRSRGAGARRFPSRCSWSPSALVQVFASVDLDAGVSWFVAFLVAMYSLGAYGSRAPAIGGLAFAVGFAGVLLSVPDFGWGDYVLWVGILAAAPWAVGRVLRSRRLQAAQLEDRAARLEHEREEQARIAVAAERARIARELHDIVAHSVSVMVVQVAVVRRRIRGDHREESDLLSEVEGTGRQAMRGAAAPARAAAHRRGGARARAPTHARAASPAARAGPRGRASGRPSHRGRSGSPAGRDRPGRLPDRAGGAHQRAQARRPRPRRGRRVATPPARSSSR